MTSIKNRSRPVMAQRMRNAKAAMTQQEATYKARVRNPVECPVCRGPASVTAAGYLRRHRDLFGHDCFNKRTP